MGIPTVLDRFIQQAIRFGSSKKFWTESPRSGGKRGGPRRNRPSLLPMSLIQGRVYAMPATKAFKGADLAELM